MTREEALQKLEQYCDYQDRCHQEVRTRLLNHKVTGDDLEWVIGALIDSGHLNEERFARSLVRGKFRIKGWGRIRLEQELQRRNIGEYIRRKAMEEVDETEYLFMLRQVLDRGMRKIPLDFTAHQKKDYLIKYGQRKGYEWEYIQRILPEVLASDLV